MEDNHKKEGPAPITTLAAGKEQESDDKHIITEASDPSKSPAGIGGGLVSFDYECDWEESPGTTANSLLDLFQWDVVLVPNDFGTKKPKIKNWQKRTIASMHGPAYMAFFDKACNIGVSLGEASNGLCTIDIDDDAAFGAFIGQNPELKCSLCSRGARGGVVWIKFKGTYPKVTQSLENAAGKKIGEFRSNGAQQIIHGLHPHGAVYRRNDRRPAKMVFSDIVWGPLIPDPPRASIESTKIGVQKEQRGQKEQKCTDGMDGTKVTEGKDVVGGFQPPMVFVSNIKSVDDAIKTSLPTSVNANHKLLFRLARAILTLNLTNGREFSPDQLKSIFNKWYEKALPFLRPGQSKEDYFVEFLEACNDAKHPLGSQTVARALASAKASPPPPEACQFENPNLKLLVGVCKQLQIEAQKRGDDLFFLSLRTIQLLFNHENHTTAGKWMKSFRVLKIVEVVEMGSGLRATRYRYKGTI